MEEFEGQQFLVDSKINFKGLSTSEFEGCTFTGIEFSNLSFRSWRFIECIFEKCSFNELDLVNATFRDVCFQDCRLMGVNWVDTNTFSNPRFENCKLDYSVFQGVDLRKVSILDCSAKDVDFTNANLSGSVFSGTNLENAVFNHSDLRMADLRNASRYFIDPQFAKIKGVKVSFPEAASFLTALGVDVSFH